MSNNTAETSLVASMNATQLFAGLAKSTEAIKGWTSKIKGTLASGLGGGLSSVLGGLGAGIGMSLWNAASSGVRSVIDGIGDLSEKIENASQNARSFGMSFESWQGLEHAAGMAGVGADQLRAAMVKLRQTHRQGGVGTRVRKA